MAHHCRECMGSCELIYAAYQRGRKESAPTGKVSEGDEALAQNIVARLNWMDFKSLAPRQLVDTITTALATVRKEVWRDAGNIVANTLPAINFSNGQYLREEILRQMEAASNGKKGNDGKKANT